MPSPNQSSTTTVIEHTFAPQKAEQHREEEIHVLELLDTRSDKDVKGATSCFQQFQQ